MTAKRRFFADATVDHLTAGFALLLDGKPVKTPAKRAFVLPTRALAEAACEEWKSQGEEIDPATMPVTRLANTVIDGLADDVDAVAAAIAAFGETDLLCYRAAAPESLSRAQDEAWQPWLEWTASTYGARLKATTGLMPLHQRKADLDRLAAVVAGFSPWEMAALYEIVALTGSLVLGLAIAAEALDAEAAWDLAHMDEAHQAERWGSDAEAEERREVRRQSLLDAVRFLALARVA